MQMRSRVLSCAVGLICGSFQAVSLSAQSLSELIPSLGFEIEEVVLDTETHRAHFQNQQGAERFNAVANALNAAIATQLSTFPLGSPGGGLTFQFDAATGGFTRNSQSLGSSFAQRALTVGKGKWNFGMSYLSQTYDSIDDIDLEDGSLQLQLEHADDIVPGLFPAPSFEADLVETQLRIDVGVDTWVAFGTYGLSDRFDVSVAVPYVTVDLDASRVFNVDRISGTGAHFFEGGGLSQTLAKSGSSSGVGDVLVRLKYRAVEAEGGGLALGLDGRLPTGDEKELLGTGVTQIRPSLIWSKDLGRLSPHVNLGYVFSSGSTSIVGDFPDELSLTVGAEIEASPAVTIAADFLGRTLYDAQRVVLEQETFPVEVQPGQTVTKGQMNAVTGDVDLWTGVLGVRFNPTGGMVVSVNSLFALSDEGLLDEDVAFTVGVDWSF